MMYRFLFFSPSPFSPISKELYQAGSIVRKAQTILSIQSKGRIGYTDGGEAEKPNGESGGKL